VNRRPRTPRKLSMAQLHRHLQAVVLELAAIAAAMGCPAANSGVCPDLAG